MNIKSDKKAKEEFAEILKTRGYSDVRIVKAPADIIATKNGEKYYFEIKKTSAKKEYFGAATLTEWRAAYSNPNNYFFVIAQETIEGFNFIEYTPDEFEKFSSIPPFKIFFNIPLNGSSKVEPKRKNRSAVQFMKEKLTKLDEIFSTFKND
ncbi:MAG: DUF3883 domain-containing protein [bacterium]|nr:DUF3883 domain-containing protein [bacterium]